MMMKTQDKETKISLIIVLFIMLVSFCLYAPCFHPDFNADHAIHVLMAKHFELPHDYYYWGQNRLGSFLPGITYLVAKIIPADLIYIISVINHLLLTGIYFLCAKLIQNNLARIAFAALMFFPLYAYYNLLLIGHPYCSQLFTMSISFYAFYKLRVYCVDNKNALSGIKPWLLGLAGVCFAFCAVWISEFSLLFLLMLLLYAIFNNETRRYILQLNILKFCFFAYLIFIGALCLWYIMLMKSHYPVNPEYDKFFISTSGEISESFGWWKAKLILLFTENDYSYLLFYSGISIVLIFLFLQQGTRNIHSDSKRSFVKSLGITIIISILVLFFSSWNHRSQFPSSYFTPVYFMVALWICIQVSAFSTKSIILLLSIPLIAITWNNYNQINRNYTPVVKQYPNFKKIPPGGLLGGYWLAYKVNAVATDNLISIAVDEDGYRNAHQIEKIFEQKRIYVIRDGYKNILPDTLTQFGHTLLKEKDTLVDGLSLGIYRKYN